MRLDDDQLVGHLLTNQRLIKLPLVRNGNATAVGADERAWKGLLPALIKQADSPNSRP
jgi:arsenate reductase-like glutaredoxin family protein